MPETGLEPDLASGGELLMRHLRKRGMRHVFVNSGTDFAPLVAAYDRPSSTDDDLPVPVLAAHENLAAGMAHGAYLATGQPQAAFFHVSVGTANAACAVMNAWRDDAPILFAAGRSPVGELGRLGSRDTHIQWGQEMLDQASLLREFVKWSADVVDPARAAPVVERALAISQAQPRGPVYLTMPREGISASADATPLRATISDATGPAPTQEAMNDLVSRISASEFPVFVTTSAGNDAACVKLLAEVAVAFGVAVIEIEPRRMNLADSHPHHLGFSLRSVLDRADLLCFIDCAVPWLPGAETVPDSTFVIQVGPDPLYVAYPTRSHRSDLSVTSTAREFLRAVAARVEEAAGVERRTERVRSAVDDRAARSTSRARAAAAEPHITKRLATSEIAKLIGRRRPLFNEYWARRDLLELSEPGSYFYLPLAGGLGWGLPAALGAKFADRALSPVAAVGDGAYMFANPAACHHVAAKYELPVLTVVANNAGWDAVELATDAMYPTREGRSGALSDLSPMPSLESYVEASGGVGLRVSRPEELAATLKRGIEIVEQDGLQVVVNMLCT